MPFCKFQSMDKNPYNHLMKYSISQITTFKTEIPKKAAPYKDRFRIYHERGQNSLKLHKKLAQRHEEKRIEDENYYKISVEKKTTHEIAQKYRLLNIL
jgi:hypothetical protein